MQSQENIEKSFFSQLQSGDYVDAKYENDEWKLAKVIGKEHKYLNLLYDGYPPNNQLVYINPMRVKPLRANTVGYTGPSKGIYATVTQILELSSKHITIIDSILKAVQSPSAYKVTQYLRGELFCSINSLLMSDFKISPQEMSIVNSFFIQLMDRIGKVCQKAKEFLPQYFDSNANNKYIYLLNYKVALVYSLQELLYLLNFFLAQGSEAPRLLKMYKNEILQENLFNRMKQYVKLFSELCAANDGNGRWLPTQIRYQLSRILITYKSQQKFLSISYDIKDYLQFYAYWPLITQNSPTKQNQQKLIEYILNVMEKQAPFDAKLKSLVILKKILEREIKFTTFTINKVIDSISKKNIVDSLLKYFNPQIFKRYIPILKITSQHTKKSFTQQQIDNLFKILKTCHESDANLIYQIIVSISQFINIEALDSIYIDIEKNIDINNESGIKFIRDFTIKAIRNYNANKNKGFLNSLIGIKKNSSKFGYYGLDLLCKEILDGNGKILAKNIPFVIANIGVIFEDSSFWHERMSCMQNCIALIQKRQSYGQSVKLLHEIICTFPATSFMIGESQQSIVLKLDEKFKLVDSFLKQLKQLQKQCNGLTSKNAFIIKIDFNTSIRYVYNFIEQFSSFFKYPLTLAHINYLWHMPHIFDFLRKSRETKEDIPSWKKRYQKKIGNQMIKGIFVQILKKNQNIIPTEECFDAIDELLISYNLFSKSIELTERVAIRYINIANIIGLNFYFKFLEKLIAMNKNDWKQNKLDTKSTQLVRKVITKIFEIHLRPLDYQNIDVKIQNWMKSLMSVVKSIHNENTQICIDSIEQFLELIRGRQFKQILLSGKIDILVEYGDKEKIITLPRNATILKLREAIMEVYKIKSNFSMYNRPMKRQLSFTEEEDFSVNAMSHSAKGPTITVRKVGGNGSLYPQFEAYERFMSMLEQQEQFYAIVFGLLKKQPNKTLHRRIWKLIDKIPVNKSIKNKIHSCKDFTRKDWQQFLQPSQIQQLQYSINIIYGFLSTTRWLEQFKNSHGNIVIEELYLLMLGTNETLSQKIITNLSKILLKLLEHNTNSIEKDGNQPPSKQEFNENLEKINNKIMENIEQEIKIHEQNKQKPLRYTIQCLNLMMKILLTSSTKRNCPEKQILVYFFLQKQILIKISDLILFHAKDTDTQFFTQDILQRIVLRFSLDNNTKFELFRQYLQKYLNFFELAKKKSVENYFTFLIDFLHTMGKEEVQKMYETYPQMVKYIKQYVLQIFIRENLGSDNKVQANQEMVHGCLKLLNETFAMKMFGYDNEKIFTYLLETYILVQTNMKQQQVTNDEKSTQQVTKSKIKHKKILYDIMKKMIFEDEKLLNIFVDKIAHKLQKAEWRINLYSSWSLEHQKREKKFFCGLENLAATCYINCLFQQLFMIKRFTDRFINIDSLSYKQSTQENEIYQLQKLLTYLKYGNKRSYTTRPFCQSFITYEGVPIDPSVQNDADQFFNALMEKIEAFLKISGNHYILQDTFEGKLSNQLNCEGCPHSSQKIQSFLSIGLDIKNKKTLEKALDGYVEGEILDGDNAYYCEKCDKKVRTMKRLCIKQCPNILVLVLKRFTYNFDQMRKIKINDQLKFSSQLNIKKYTSQYHLQEQCKPDEYYDYKLRGVVIHAGTSQGGHYYSFIKQGSKQENAKWFEFNDEVIEQAEYKRIEEEGFGGEDKESQYRSEKYRNAYILLYEKKNMEKHEAKIQQNKEGSQQQSFETQLAQVVKTQNRNADFLSIILDQFFIKLCENIVMCGVQKAHHFILLYFHTVLLRDRNKEEYLSNIYHMILKCMEKNPDLSKWYLEQIDHYYVKEFLIEAPKLIKYLCLGFVIEAMKAVIEHQKELKAKNQVKYQVEQHEQETNVEQKDQKKIETQSATKVYSIQQDSNKVQQKTEKNAISEAETKEQIHQNANQPQKINQTKDQEEKVTQAKKGKVQQKQSPSHAQDFEEEQEDCIEKLIPIFISCLKKKGMTPFAKIFTKLASIQKYRQKLLAYQYPQRVCSLIEKGPKFANPIQYENRQSYFGRESSSCKQKELQTSFIFLVESLKYFPGCLSKQNILGLLSETTSRAPTKALTFLLAKSSVTNSQVFANIDAFQCKLKGQKCKKQDVQKYLFLIRNYFFIALAKAKKSQQDNAQFVESTKTYCINSLEIVLKQHKENHMIMQLCLLEINKLAFRSSEFKRRWINKVQSSLALLDRLESLNAQGNWYRYLQKSQEFKKRLINLDQGQKQTLIRRSKEAQISRTLWMLSSKTSSKYSIQEPQSDVPEIYSDIETTEVNKYVSMMGYRSYRICDRLGILTKIEDEKGNNRWAIYQRNQIQSYFDF